MQENNKQILDNHTTTVSKLVVWKARYKGSVNGFKIAPPSSGRGSADFFAESLMVQGVLNARRWEERSVLSILEVVLGRKLNISIKWYVERTFTVLEILMITL